ncbi:hypothetical protein [Nocardioides sp. GY 10127]|uniref:hypothetical protein n=1 Tax=Nocardioides sp. GY 10127 TaxID=2569762 RepID=UPI0010A7EAE2|nr:hypothetical protein [Nocardioides sp. GY 10127]TIC79938.1 hypothetical protein E8D37_14930 [Nocardioides sp. GY 10127]
MTLLVPPSRRRASVLALALALCVLPALVAVGGTASADAGAGSSTASARLTGTRKVVSVLRWRGNHGARQKSVTIPGVGVLTAVCRPDETLLNLTPYERAKETQMWLAKYTKNPRTGKVVSVAVKNVRVYKYATADDDGTGGTGKASHEGLNLETPVEARGAGYAHGVISQRRGRNAAVGGSFTTPVSSVETSWYWEGFHRKDVSKRFCRIRTVVRTTAESTASATSDSDSRPFGLSWHGESDSALRKRTFTLGKAGTVSFTCREADDVDDAVETVTFTPTTAPASGSEDTVNVWFETIEAEGAEDDHVVTDQYDYDPDTESVPPIQLPENGMLRLYYTDGARTRHLIVSSYWVVNDDDPDLNLCEVAAARF